MDAAFTILSAIIWIVIVVAFANVFARKGRRTISSDGHAVPKNQDLTCETKAGHVHPEISAKDKADYGARYIVHNDPEMGYVVLNGVKRKISECKDL